MKSTTKQKISKSLKKHHQKKKFKRDLAYVITVTVILTYFFGMNNALQAIEREIPSERPQPFVFVEKSTTGQIEANNEVLEEDVESIKAYIEREAVKHGINPETALRIAHCESRYKANAKNPNSSATGIYQFINKTWNHYCEGDRLNAKDNIDCFMRIYPRHSSWWLCQ